MQSFGNACYCCCVARLENRLDAVPHTPEAPTPANPGPVSAGQATQGAALSDGGAVLARTLAKARWNIFWERMWPPVALVATVVGFFLAASWLGLWMWLPPL